MPAAKTKSAETSAPDLLVLAFEIVAETGWRGFSFAELANRSTLSMMTIREAFSGRAGLLDALNQRLDQAMLAVEPDDLDELPPRDRVFELIMSRIEAMAPLKQGLGRLIRDARFDPELVVMTACRLDRSLSWLQDAAGLDCGQGGSLFREIRSRFHRRVLGAVYLQTLNVWSEDDSTDLAKTMASLDKQLRRVESLAGLASSKRAKEPSVGAA